MNEFGHMLGNVLGLPQKPDNRQEQLRPDQKARNAFLPIVTQMLAGEPVSAALVHNPPYPTFDLRKIGDATVFRINSTLSPDSDPDTAVPDETWGCVAFERGSNTPKLFILDKSVLTGNPRPARAAASGAMPLRPAGIRIREVRYEDPVLNWEHPDRTFPVNVFDLPAGVKHASLTVRNVEIITVGTYLKDRKPDHETVPIATTRIARQPVPIPGTGRRK